MNSALAHQVELENRERTAIDLVGELEKINKKMAKLRLDKEKLEVELIGVIGHDYEGSKTYDIGQSKVVIKTEKIYALDKAAYRNGDLFLPDEFDPVLKSISYEVNKKLFNSFVTTAPFAVRETLNKLITLKDSKPGVTIKVRS